MFAVSAVVFTNSVPMFGVGLRMQCFAEVTIKIVVSASFEKAKMAKKVK